MTAGLVKTFVFGILGVTALVLVGVFHIGRHYELIEAGTMRGLADERIRKLERQREALQTEYDAQRGVPVLLQRISRHKELHHPTEAAVIKMAPPSQNLKLEGPKP